MSKTLADLTKIKSRTNDYNKPKMQMYIREQTEILSYLNFYKKKSNK